MMLPAEKLVLQASAHERAPAPGRDSPADYGPAARAAEPAAPPQSLPPAAAHRPAPTRPALFDACSVLELQRLGSVLEL